jgi:hypothetical protein
MEAVVKNPLRAFYILAVYAILTFLWRFLVPAHEEAESDTLIYMEILFELGTIPVLIGLVSHLRPRLDVDSKWAVTVVFWIALAASLCILWMRFRTEHGWYTGHRVYEIGNQRYN